MDEKTNQAIKVWKNRVAEWIPTSRLVFSYIRNPLPAKSFALALDSGGIVDSPS